MKILAIAAVSSVLGFSLAGSTALADVRCSISIQKAQVTTEAGAVPGQTRYRLSARATFRIDTKQKVNMLLVFTDNANNKTLETKVMQGLSFDEPTTGAISHGVLIDPKHAYGVQAVIADQSSGNVLCSDSEQRAYVPAK